MSPTLASLHCACVCPSTCMLACLLGLTTYHKFQMSAFKYFTKVDIVKHVRPVEGYVCFFKNKLSQLRTKLHGRLLTDGMKLLQVSKLRSRNSAHDLLSPCMCPVA